MKTAEVISSWGPMQPQRKGKGQIRSSSTRRKKDQNMLHGEQQETLMIYRSKEPSWHFAAVLKPIHSILLGRILSKASTWKERKYSPCWAKREAFGRSGVYNLNPKINSGACTENIAAQREGTEGWAPFQSQVIGRLRMISIYITF